MFFFFTTPPPSLFDPILMKVEAALRVAEKEHPQMTVAALATLLYVAQHQREILDQRLSIAALADRIGSRKTTIARHADILGEGIAGKDGLGLLERAIDEKSRKVRLLTVSPKGVEFLRRIEAALIDQP